MNFRALSDKNYFHNAKPKPLVVSVKNEIVSDDNQTKIRCECGKIISKKHLHRHLKSKIHEKWVSKQGQACPPS